MVLDRLPKPPTLKIAVLAIDFFSISRRFILTSRAKRMRICERQRCNNAIVELSPLCSCGSLFRLVSVRCTIFLCLFFFRCRSYKTWVTWIFCLLLVWGCLRAHSSAAKNHLFRLRPLIRIGGSLCQRPSGSSRPRECAAFAPHG